MARQLTFDLPCVPALGREDFFVSSANAMAVAGVEGWRDWPHGKLAICGAHGAGKTHLAHVFAAASGARIVAASDLAKADIPDLARGPVAVENVPAIAGNEAAERALFHLHNLSLAEGGALLFTGTDAPGRWPLTLPDLASRVQATTMARIDPPDDDLLGAVMSKMFGDRQLDVDPGVIAYLTRRMDRSFAAATQVVTALDTLSLSEQRPITRPLAARVLDSLAA